MTNKEPLNIYRDDKRNNHKCGGKRNFGYGSTPKYAASQAFHDEFGWGRYSTKRTYNQRFGLFIDFLERLGISDMRLVTRKEVEDYANEIRQRVDSGDLTVKTGQNYVSAVNRGMKALRGDNEMYLSPSKYIGRRSYVRKEAPVHVDEASVQRLVRYLIAIGKRDVAAMVLLCRYAATRSKEALLLNFKNALRQLYKTNQLYLSKGTKGGRKRNFAAGIRVKAILESLKKHHKGKNLVSGYRTYHQSYNAAHYQLRKACEALGLKGLTFKELRTECLAEIYEKTTGYPVPYKTCGRTASKAIDLKGRKAVAKVAGHSREQIAGAYVGTRIRAAA